MMRRLPAALTLIVALAASANAQLVICGDVDGTQRLNVLDALWVAQESVGILTFTAVQETQADVDGDAASTIMDALRIARFVVGLVTDMDCLGQSSSTCGTPGAAISDFTTTNVNLMVASTATINNDLRIEVGITHTYIGDLRVTIIHPDATAVILHNRTGGGAQDIVGTYPTTLTPAQSLAAFNGKPANGTWTLRVRDEAGGDVGTIDSWCIHIGSPPRSVSSVPYAFLDASRTGNNLIRYPFARLTGGGIPENTIQFYANIFSTGPNQVDEQGGGDDVDLGPIPGGTWSTTLTPSRGTIDAMTGFFIAGDVTGSGMVNYTNPTYGNAMWQVASVPPDWIIP